MKNLLMGMLYLTAFSAMASSELNSQLIKNELYHQVENRQFSCIRQDGLTSKKLNDTIKLHLLQYLGSAEIPVAVNVDLNQPVISSFQVLYDAEIKTNYTTNPDFTKLESVEVVHTTLSKTQVNEGTIIQPKYVIKVDKKLLYQVNCDVK